MVSETNGRLSLSKKTKKRIQKIKKVHGLNKAIFKPIQNNLEGMD